LVRSFKHVIHQLQASQHKNHPISCHFLSIFPLNSRPSISDSAAKQFSTPTTHFVQLNNYPRAPPATIRVIDASPIQRTQIIAVRPTRNCHVIINLSRVVKSYTCPQKREKKITRPCTRPRSPFAKAPPVPFAHERHASVYVSANSPPNCHGLDNDCTGDVLCAFIAHSSLSACVFVV
jgi:hypothetical protein